MAPFVVLTVLSLLSFLGVLLLFPPDGQQEDNGRTLLSNFGTVFKSGTALAALSVMLLISLANQLINVVFGVWLNDSFGLQIAALGGASAVIGIAELIGEGGVSAFADRISSKKALFIGVAGSVLSAAVLPLLGNTVWGAYIGLFFYYLSFEFAIVSIVPLMTGILPEVRGTMLAVNVASSNLGRGLGSLIAAPLFLGGFWVTAVAVAIVNLLAILVLRYVVVQEQN